ncbi:hypothetical protein CHS0354_005797 [Potamilus streckersoni]|uniref:CCHC-type domain-containing protein n=1 Tax=Potamilus streckersoni TaxID=2493646 RepID=A0AAE0VV32_9BIVA|nr:hypothetical protein CHS0354_005797 [Potamilus streckersoni]
MELLEKMEHKFGLKPIEQHTMTYRSFPKLLSRGRITLSETEAMKLPANFCTWYKCCQHVRECYKCGNVGHLQRDCPVHPTIQDTQNVHK